MSVEAGQRRHRGGYMSQKTVRVTVVVIVVVIAAVLIFDLYPSRVDILSGQYRPGEQTLQLGVNTCAATHFVSTDETPEQVRVTTRAIRRSGNDCQDLVEVQLERPLEDRDVVDTSDGVTVGIPN
ncbi:MAG: hypothetical protein R3324_02825 [Halobacteriales archaeon]|nr:hypothetical protein [Halobacteriales archaeon]